MTRMPPIDPPTLVADAPGATEPVPESLGNALEITLHGRGGQGAQVACQILADAFFRSGHWVQAFAAYGGERRGAPVRAALRVQDRPIRVRCDVEQPHHAIVLDPTLLPSPTNDLVRSGGIVVVNSPTSPCGFMPMAGHIVTVDVAEIARRAGLGPLVATAALGAFAGATGLVTLDALVAAVEAGSPSKVEANIAACREAYGEAARLLPGGRGNG